MDTIIQVAVSLFFVLDPIGNVPIIATILKNKEGRKKQWIIFRESFFALLLMVIFLFFGPVILKYMGIDQSSMDMAGGVVLFLIALRMSFPTKDSEDEHTNLNIDPFFVPIAIPLIAGPGVLGMVMLTARLTNNTVWSFVSLLIAWAASTIILLCSGGISRIMGVRGMMAVQRLMGLALTAMSVHMFMIGFKTFMHAPPPIQH